MNKPDSTAIHRILVIDDNPAIHEDFRKILCHERSGSQLEAAEAFLFGDTATSKNQQQFEVHSAYQGQEGLARVYHAIQAGFPYEVAFVDVRMPPGWDGIEVTPRLWIADPQLQIVICTAYADYSWEQMIERVGASDRMFILSKPFDRMEVLQLAHTLTKKRQSPQETKWELEHPGISAQQRMDHLQDVSDKLYTEIMQLMRTGGF
jgi:two-component system, NtrC family, sensor kinase